MNFDLQLESQPAELINIDKFQEKLKTKKHKKNELEEISEFNRKCTKSSQSIQTGELGSSEFDLKAWGQQLNNKKQIDFFDQEGKQLLGAERSVKYLDWKLILVSVILHVTVTWNELKEERYFELAIHNIPIFLLIMVIVYDMRYKIVEKHRTKVYKVYKQLLIISLVLTLFNIFLTFIQIWSNQYFDLQIWFKLLLYVALLTCEIKLYKANSYLLFITSELSKKYQEQFEEDLSDNL